MEAQRGEYSIAELCRKHGKSQTTFYKSNKEFMEAGKKRLSDDLQSVPIVWNLGITSPNASNPINSIA